MDSDSVPLITTLIKLVAYVGPFFFIPALFKFAGGVFANLAGMANDRSRGLFDRSRKYRQQKYGKNWGDFKAGQRKFRPAAFNKVGRRVGAGASGRFGFGAAGRQAMALDEQNNADEALKNNHRLQKLAYHDDGNAVMALSGGTRAGAEAAARELFTDEDGNYDAGRAERALAAASAVGYNRNNARAAMTTLAQNKARAVAGGARGRAIMQNGIDRLGQSAEERHDLRDNFAYHAFSNGRADLGATNWGSASATIDGFDRAGASAVANGHLTGVESTGDALLTEYRDAEESGDFDRQIEAASRMVAMRNGIGAHTPDANKQAINRMLESAGIDLEAQESVDEQFGARIGGLIGPPQPVPPLPAALGSDYTADDKQAYDDAVRAHQEAKAANAAPARGATERIKNRAGLYDTGVGRYTDPAVQSQQAQQQGQGGPGPGP